MIDDNYYMKITPELCMTTWQATIGTMLMRMTTILLWCTNTQETDDDDYDDFDEDYCRDHWHRLSFMHRLDSGKTTVVVLFPFLTFLLPTPWIESMWFYCGWYRPVKLSPWQQTLLFLLLLFLPRLHYWFTMTMILWPAVVAATPPDNADLAKPWNFRHQQQQQYLNGSGRRHTYFFSSSIPSTEILLLLLLLSQFS